MTFENFLQFLNLPIVGGLAWLVYQAGYIRREINDYGRRISDLERRQRSFRGTTPHD